MQKLDPKAVWLFFIRGLFAVAFPVVFFFVYFLMTFNSVISGKGVAPLFLGTTLILLPLIILILVIFIWAKLYYRFYRYELREDGFRKELGVIWKKYVTIPYDRIQNVDIHRGPVARLLGLSDLSIQTAGASARISRYGTRGLGAEGKLPGLSREIAEDLRDELVKRARSSKNQGL